MIFLYFASDTFASRAKVLTDSIKKYHPQDTIVHIKPDDGPLGQYIPNMAEQRLKTALELIENTKEDICIIGADCELFYPLQFHAYADLYIVPHVKEPVPNRDYMCQIYTSGHANADLMVFRNCENSENILQWLIQMTRDGVTPGAFYEQTWLSATPFLFDRVKIIREPGYNIGYWDINHIDFEKRTEKYTVYGQPLVMFQYSGYEKGKPEAMSRHSWEKAKNDTILEFYKHYDERIES